MSFKSMVSNNFNIDFVNSYTTKELVKHYSNKISTSNLAENKNIIVIGNKSFNSSLKRRVNKLKIGIKYLSIPVVFTPQKFIAKLVSSVDKNTEAIYITVDDPKVVTNLVQKIMVDSVISSIKIVFKISLGKYHQSLRTFEKYPQDIAFIDSQLDYSVFNKVYSRSLKKFEQKCQVRDAWDMFQVLSSTVKVKGDIIEIGSYKGHSGWLIDNFSKKSNPEKNIYLLDTFDKFPNESIGIDKIWSNTHVVDFLDVKKKFKNSKRVRLIKGDIRQAILSLKQRYSFIYLDIDSYDATLIALKLLYPKLNKGGVILSQDYGKPHCLGARLAVDKYFKNKKVVSYFSFFSGCKIITKI